MDKVMDKTCLNAKELIRRSQRFGLLAGAAILATACDVDVSTSGQLQAVAGQGAVVIDPALAFPELRRLDRERLQLELLLNGSRIDTERDSDGRWNALVQVPRGVQLNLRSTISQDGLVLARSTRQVPVGLEANEVQIDIPSDSYDSNFDADNDRLSNLFELENDSNPSDSGDPGLEINEAGIRLLFERPVVLGLLNSELVGQARLEASLNGEAIEVQAVDSGFVADAMVVDNSRVYVEAFWFLDNPAALAIAGLKRSDSARDGQIISYAADTYRLQFDDDFDGVENASEVRFQSDPTDAASRPVTAGNPDPSDTPDDEPAELMPTTPDSESPPAEEEPEQEPEQEPSSGDEAAEACAVSVFAEGCNSDFDRDGIPDSEEGREGDADDDSIPDWMESINTDTDGDGTSAQFDVNEADPCSPDASAFACVVLSSDADGDGKLDSEEGDVDSDGDGKLDADESAIDDSDDDGTPDEEDEDDSDPCIPRATRPFCN